MPVTVNNIFIIVCLTYTILYIIAIRVLIQCWVYCWRGIVMMTGNWLEVPIHVLKFLVLGSFDP